MDDAAPKPQKTNKTPLERRVNPHGAYIDAGSPEIIEVEFPKDDLYIPADHRGGTFTISKVYNPGNGAYDWHFKDGSDLNSRERHYAQNCGLKHKDRRKPKTQ